MECGCSETSPNKFSYRHIDVKEAVPQRWLPQLVSSQWPHQLAVKSLLLTIIKK